MTKSKILILVYIVIFCCSIFSKSFLEPGKKLNAYNFSSLSEAAMPLGSSIETGYFVEFNGIRYFIKSDDFQNVNYVRVWDYKFKCPEGYTTRKRFKDVDNNDINKIYALESIDKIVVVLKSGWKMLFSKNNFSVKSKPICFYFGDDF